MRLKTRLTLTFTAVTAAVQLASFVLVYVLVERDELRDFDRGLLVQAEQAAERAVERDVDHPYVRDGRSELPETPALTTRYSATYDDRGALISATRSFAGEAPSYASIAEHVQSGSAVEFRVRGVVLRGIVVPARKSKLLYAVARKPIDDDLMFLVRVFSSLFVVATVVTSVVARWLGRRLSHDVDTIAEVARRVAEGDLRARVAGHARATVETHVLAEDLDHMISQLEALVAAQRVFISHAAHELRSPLTSLRGELQLALRRPRGKDEYRATIEQSLRDVDQLVALSEDLLTLARSQAGATQSRDITSVQDLLDAALRMAAGTAHDAGVTFVVEGGSELSETKVRCGRSDVARALRNLFDNAATHGPVGGRVVIRVEEDRARVCVLVEDDGSGVAEDDIGKLFSPFFRGSHEQSGERGGAGLGLAIAREIARAHDGDVTYRPRSPGACFVLELPRA